MFKLFLLFSITFNTLGLSGTSFKVDQGLISKSAGDAVIANAENRQLTLPNIAPYPSVDQDVVNPNIYAKKYILVDNDSGTILASEGPHDKVPIASTTKIMTAIVALQNYSLDDIATVQKDAVQTVSSAGAIPDFYSNERMTIRNLLWCMLMNSSNVAAYALAEHMSSKNETGPEKFVALMNQKARDLGLKNTNYRDPAGLDGTGYSTAYDLVLATREAMKNSLFAQMVGTKQTTVYDEDRIDVHPLNNSNRLVNEWDYPGTVGVKTGYMPDTAEQSGAGHCLVAAVKREGHTLISVVLNTAENSATASATESRKLQDWGWANTKWK